MNRGAQPSELVAKLFRTVGLDNRYDRFKKGEALDVLLAEAAASETARGSNQKTSQENQEKKAKKA